jgi:hypothetical protein
VAFEEHAQDGVRRDFVPNPSAVRAAPFALLRNTRKTACGAKLFLTRSVVRAAPFALLRNTRKTECGAKRFLTNPLAVRAARFALTKKNQSVDRECVGA